MISRIPTWAWVGAWLLAFTAGIVNVVGLLSFEHQAVTHLTGNASLVAAAMVSGDSSGAIHIALLMGAFVAGAAASGMLIQDTTLQLGRRYGVALLLVSLLLVGSVPLLQQGNGQGLYFAAAACGLQNAMASTYSGAVIRTTHLSGMFTDLGIFLGHAIRGLPVDPRRLRLCVLVITGFIAGGGLGTWVFGRIGYQALLVPAAITGGVALAYGWYSLGRR